MTEDNLNDIVEKLSEDDEVVLQCIDQGLDHVRKMTAATRLDKDDVNNSYRKLSRLDLIEVGDSEGWVEDHINGKRQVFRDPKDAWFTDRGEKVVRLLEKDRIEEYQSLTQDELAAKVVALEDEVEELERKLDNWKSQIQAMLPGGDNDG